MSKSETPRTDVIHELRKDRENLSQYFYMVDHARQLERELTAAREEITILKSKYADHHAEAERLTSEIRSVTEQRDGLRSGIDYASDQLSKVTEQRDEARRLAEKYRNLSCDSQDEADETLLPWEITNPNEL
jgi:chromosome segregation ATPase